MRAIGEASGEQCGKKDVKTNEAMEVAEEPEGLIRGKLRQPGREQAEENQIWNKWEAYYTSKLGKEKETKLRKGNHGDKCFPFGSNINSKQMIINLKKKKKKNSI